MGFRRLDATARRLNPVVALVFLSLGVAPEVVRADSLYTVAKVAVDTTAKDAVVARSAGLIQAERRATRILFSRIVPFSVQPYLPALSQEEIQGLIAGIAVRKERTSATRYIASLDVRFDPVAVRRLLAKHAIPILEDRAPSITILPLMLAADGVREGQEEAWRAAWEQLDLAHSIAPATLVRPRPDLAVATVRGALAGDFDAMASMRSAYGYGGLVIAAGSLEGGQLRVRLFGDDAVGSVRLDQVHAADALPEAAAAAFAALESRWKTIQEGGTLPEANAFGQDDFEPDDEEDGTYVLHAR